MVSNSVCVLWIHRTWHPLGLHRRPLEEPCTAHRKNEQLKTLVNQRTLELEQQTQKLIQANRAKQNFLASMSHEMRNPLNGILGIARLLYDTEARQGKPSEQIRHLYTCSKHLHQLLGQTLDYSSFEAGKLSPRIGPFQPNELLDEVVQMQQEAAEAKGIQLILHSSPIHEQWLGDPVLLRQILINLISNGIKYTPSGSVTLTLSYQRQAKSVHACFDISDTGPGIPPDRRSYIFREFTRLPESEAKQIPGTGLGLKIASEMAQLMDGSLELDPDYSGGARFLLTLEFGTQPLTDATPPADKAIDRQALAGKEVLIADDMDFNRYVSAEVLRSMGARTDEAKDGVEALNKLRQVAYDIAVLDISMPRMSGIEAVQAFLADPKGPAPDFIALSAHNTAEMEASCRPPASLNSSKSHCSRRNSTSCSGATT